MSRFRLYIASLLVVSLSSALAVGAQNFWQPTGGPEGGIIETLARGSNGDLLAGSRWSGRAYRSVDDGLTWTRLDLDVSPGWITQFAADSEGTLFAAASCGDVGCSNQSGVYRSTNGGETWSHVGLLGEDPRHRSADGGLTWVRADQGLGLNEIIRLAFAPNGAMFAAGMGFVG